MNNSEEAIKLLNTKLREYLKLKSIKINSIGKFSCIVPEHADVHPSMNLFKDENSNNELAFCQSCKTTCNIFHAAFSEIFHWFFNFGFILPCIFIWV